MPSGLSSGDRKILGIAGAAFLALVVVGFFLAPDTESSVATTYSTASEGAKAAFLFLRETGYRVQRWQQPLTALKPDTHTVWIIADPAMIPDEKEKAAIERFISGGGRVITNGVMGARFLPEDFSELNEAPKNPWTEFNALTPSAITRAAPKITLAPVAHWSRSSGVRLYGDNEDTVVIRYAHGQGDAIWLASATPFTNAGIERPGNLEFFLAAIGDKELTRVLFDEYVHGYGELGAPEKRHPLTTALLLQSVVLVLAMLFTFSRRSGPLRPMPAPSRLAPLEFVETLGGLYHQAHAASVAVDVYYQRFQYWITRRLGLTSTASPEELARATRDRFDVKEEAFLRTLQDAAGARYQPDLPQKRALEIVQSLHSYAVKLKLFTAAKDKEKH